MCVLPFLLFAFPLLQAHSAPAHRSAKAPFLCEGFVPLCWLGCVEASHWCAHFVFVSAAGHRHVWSAIGFVQRLGRSLAAAQPSASPLPLPRVVFLALCSCISCTVAPEDTRLVPFCSSTLLWYPIASRSLGSTSGKGGLTVFPAPGFTTGVSSSRYVGGPSGPFLAPFASAAAMRLQSCSVDCDVGLGAFGIAAVCSSV